MHSVGLLRIIGGVIILLYAGMLISTQLSEMFNDLLGFSRKKFAKERVICFFMGHDVPKDHLVHDMGALFSGGICKRCRRFKLGKFVFNIWDESKTVESNGVVNLSGTNPRVEAEGWRIIGDIDEVAEVSDLLCSKEKPAEEGIV